MKPTVSFETARKLAEAGFMPPEVVGFGQFFWVDGGLKTVEYVSNSGNIDLISDHSYSTEFTKEQLKRLTTFAPTATDILVQMPEGTRLVKHGAGWVCAWDLDYIGASIDNREDACPHECAAKAFLAWKAGNS